MKLSIIIPIYKSENSIVALVKILAATLNHITFEIILVNDGSPDTSHQVCIELEKQYQNVHYILLRRNFGEFNAVMCGLNWAQGDYCVMIDDDFQNPPSEILLLIKEADLNQQDVVYTYYDKKEHALYRNLGSKLINWVTSFLLGKPKDLYLSSFKLIRRELVNEITKYKGPYPYIDGLIFRNTQHIGKVKVKHHLRETGVSNYTFKKLISLVFNILFCYSTLPIRLFMPLSLGLLALGGLLLVFFAGQWVVGPDPKQWQVVTATLIFIGGLQCTILSVLGEYIGKGFLSQAGQPQYTIKYNSIISDDNK